MSDQQFWSWVVTFVGLAGFVLAGRKVWWAWYVNIANQALWVIFALVTGYYAFLVGTVFYTIVFVRNAYLWTKDHYHPKPEKGKVVGRVLSVTEDKDGLTAAMQIDDEVLMQRIAQGALGGFSVGPGFVPVYDKLSNPSLLIGKDHICHSQPSPSFSHALVCLTGEHPTGWMHMQGPHNMCGECGPRSSDELVMSMMDDGKPSLKHLSREIIDDLDLEISTDYYKGDMDGGARS